MLQIRKLINLSNIFDDERPTPQPTTIRRQKYADVNTNYDNDDDQQHKLNKREKRDNPIENLGLQLIANHQAKKVDH